LLSQVIEARTELGAEKEVCERLREECRYLGATVEALNTPAGWMGGFRDRRSKRELAVPAGVGRFGEGMCMRKRDELAALREEVRKAEFAEANQQEPARQIEAELVSVRVASGREGE
jgi:hypothetical protein